MNTPPPALADLPPLGEVLRRHAFVTRKRLGQHFLLDPGLLARIARAAGPIAGAHVLEVGPGPGGLTRALLAGGPAKLVAIERDRRCVDALAELVAAAPEILRVVEADALDVDERGLLDPPIVVVANLPYNVATPLLIKWLDRTELFARLVLMFQREVASRLLAPPGGKAYGRLAVQVQWRCHVRKLLDLPARAFVPPPKVDSTLIELVPRSTPLAPADPEDLARVLAAAFGQRRKMLRQSLRTLGIAVEPLLAAAAITPECRPETLTIEEFCRLARALRAHGKAAAN